jgi:hypothetical protein
MNLSGALRYLLSPQQEREKKMMQVQLFSHTLAVIPTLVTLLSIKLCSRSPTGMRTSPKVLTVLAPGSFILILLSFKEMECLFVFGRKVVEVRQSFEIRLRVKKASDDGSKAGLILTF